MITQFVTISILLCDIEIQHMQSLCFVQGLFHIELYDQQSMCFITSQAVSYKFQLTERIKSVYKGQGCKIKMKFELNMARDPLTKYCYYLNYLFDCNVQNNKKILETLLKGRTQSTCLSN